LIFCSLEQPYFEESLLKEGLLVGGDDRMKNRWVFGVFSILLVSLACNTSITASQEPTTRAPDLNATLMSLSIQQTQTAMAGGQPTILSTNTSQPTATVPPTTVVISTSTTVPSATDIPTPCNLAGNVIDITYADGAKVAADTSFVKTWRITNIGSCTWTSGYSLIFDSGDQMNAPFGVQLTPGTVLPGNSAEVSVQLKAPHAKGTYQGFFRLKASDGSIFGIGSTGVEPFWVLIKVPAPTAVPLPDLKITAVGACDSPKQGVPCVIKVSVYNSGDISVSTPFKVLLYIGSAASPKCSWVIDSISKGGGYVKSCSYTFPSWYGSISLKAIADAGNVIVESNEGNNQLSVNISVAP
jgi:hypothetical protein